MQIKPVAQGRRPDRGAHTPGKFFKLKVHFIEKFEMAFSMKLKVHRKRHFMATKNRNRAGISFNRVHILVKNPEKV